MNLRRNGNSNAKVRCSLPLHIIQLTFMASLATTARARQLLADAALEAGVDNTSFTEDYQLINDYGGDNSEMWHDVLDHKELNEYPSRDGQDIDDARQNAIIEYALLYIVLSCI
jgi:hypothetical protein